MLENPDHDVVGVAIGIGLLAQPFPEELGTYGGSATAPIRVVFASAPMRASITSSFPRELSEAPRATLGRDDPYRHKHDAIAPSLARTSENSVKRKFNFREFIFHALQ